MSDRIYLVEDDHAVLSALVALLSLEGFAPAHFRTADEFLAAVGTLIPACVIFNVRLPGTSGIDAAAQMRTFRLDWPVVLISGDLDCNLEVAAKEVGATYLTKPFSAEALILAIRGAQKVRHAGLWVPTAIDPD